MCRRIAWIVFMPVLLFSMRAQSAIQDDKKQIAVATGSQGQKLFASSCAGCHGLDGRGAERGPNLATNANVHRLSNDALLKIIREGIPAGGMPGFGTLLNDAQTNAVLEYLRYLQGRRGATRVSGDPKQGEKLFFGKARCSDCHMMHGRGGFIGSDLSSYGSSHSPSDIRDLILHPDRDLNPQYETVTVVTDDGHQYTGVVRNQDNFSLELQTADGVFHFFDKTGLAHVERARRSVMPDDYGKTLSEAEINDIVAYLLASASKEPARNDGREQR